VHGSCASPGRHSQTVAAAAGEFEHDVRPVTQKMLKSRKVIGKERRLATRDVAIRP
jgi:hypothetical protein